MKDYELLDAIGGIDEKFVLLASDEKPARRAVVLKFAILAAAIVAVAVTAFAITLGMKRPTAAPVVLPDVTESGTAPFSGTEPIATFEDNTDTESDTETEERTETDPVPISSEEDRDPEQSYEPSGDVSVIDAPTPVTPPDSGSDSQPIPDRDPDKTESQSVEKDPTPQTETETERDSETTGDNSPSPTPPPPDQGYTFDSIDKLYVALESMNGGGAGFSSLPDDEVYPYFKEFRGKILSEKKIVVPVIDGEELLSDVTLYKINAYERPWIEFHKGFVEIWLTYLDDDLAWEASEKGCGWLQEKLEPGGCNTYNYLEYREKYAAAGIGQLATITVTEETVTFDGKEIKALVASYLNGTGERELVTVLAVSGNVCAMVGGFPEDVWDVIARMTFTDHRFD